MNKFTRMIDSMFEKYGPDRQNIILCSKDEFCANWDYYSYASPDFTRNSHAVGPEDEKLAEEFADELDRLVGMLLDSFGSELNLEKYDRQVNDYYMAYVYVDRSYKIRCVLTDVNRFNNEAGDLLVNLNLYDEDCADRKHDEQMCNEIESFVNDINDRIAKLDSDAGKARARELIDNITKL